MSLQNVCYCSMFMSMNTGIHVALQTLWHVVWQWVDHHLAFYGTKRRHNYLITGSLLQINPRKLFIHFRNYHFWSMDAKSTKYLHMISKLGMKQLQRGIIINTPTSKDLQCHRLVTNNGKPKSPKRIRKSFAKAPSLTHQLLIQYAHILHPFNNTAPC